MHPYLRLVVALCAVPLGAMAQPPSDSRPPASNAPVTAAPTYQSVFSHYRGLTDEKVDWMEANGNVGRIGGWRTYLRESQRSDTPAEKATQHPQAEPITPASNPSTPAPGSHGGHKH